MRKIKNDLKYVAAARELRDRYLQPVNADPGAPGLPEAHGKYAITRQIKTQRESSLLPAV